MNIWGIDWQERKLISKLHMYIDQSVSSIAGPRGDKKCEDWEKCRKRMLFVTDSIQLVERIPHQGSSRRV
jgi:hypothetical protein